MANRRRKILIGCLVFLGVVLIAAMLGIWYLSSQLGKEGVLPDSDLHPLLRGDEVMQLSLTLDVEDAGQRELLKAFLSTLSKRDLPKEWGLWRSSLEGIAEGDPRELLGSYMPITHVLLSYEGTTGLETLSATSFSKGYEVFRWLIQPKVVPGTTEELYREQTVITNTSTGATALFLDNHLLHCTSVARMHEAIDQLLDTSPGRLPEEIQSLLDLVDYSGPKTDLWNFDRNPKRNLLTMIALAESFPLVAWTKVKDLSAYALAVDFVDGSILNGAVALQFPATSDARSNDEKEKAALQVIQGLLPPGLSVRDSTGTWHDGQVLLLELTVEGTGAFFSQLAQDLDISANNSGPDETLAPPSR